MNKAFRVDRELCNSKKKKISTKGIDKRKERKNADSPVGG